MKNALWWGFIIVIVIIGIMIAIGVGDGTSFLD